MVTKRCILLVLLLLLACGGSALASPLYNLSSTGSLDKIPTSSSLDQQHDSIMSFSDDIIGSKLAMFGAEFKKIPVLGNVENSAEIKSLPPVPQALFMALTGFLCISFVRDRKVWLASCAAVFYLGCAGINVLPNLGSHLSLRTAHLKQSVQNEASYSCQHGKYFNRPVKIDGIWYTGLLRHLAGIPGSDRDFNSDSVLTNQEFSDDSGFVCLQTKMFENSAFISKEHLFPLLPHGPPVFV